MRTLMVLLFIITFLFGSLAQAQTQSRLPKGIRGLEEGQTNPPGANWLLDAKDDTERFRRIQIYAGGTYEQMWQIGFRYQQTYRAIIDENWELGAYHWGKLRDVLNVALMKRPNRTPNAEAMFLDNSWALLNAALSSKDAQASRQAFMTQRGTCMACHIAENMPFLNDTPIFRDTGSFP
ncbi:MAG: hypothetical protein WD772_02145 [Pseudohongiellaceae bacterium]